MNDQPSASELIAAVKSFIENTAMPQLTGHAAFHARVAMNALDTVSRELETRPEAEAREQDRLSAILGFSGSVEALNRKLCDAIRGGEIDHTSEGVLQHLRLTVIDQVRIDQPRYSGLREAEARQS